MDVLKVEIEGLREANHDTACIIGSLEEETKTNENKTSLEFLDMLEAKYANEGDDVETWP